MGEETVSRNFIEQEIDKDLAEGVYSEVCTRFPPEPNGYLHIGHAKSILLNSGLAKKYNGTFHLRFDDTNPTKEDMEFVESIKEDVKWLGADWKEHLYFASDYFEVMYECALKLIRKGKAFVCDLTADEIREYRGTLKEPGKDSPYRGRSVEENLRLFEEMKDGKYKDGEKVLRAKIDMASPNINMRDPVIYRVAHRQRPALVARTGSSDRRKDRRRNRGPRRDLRDAASDRRVLRRGLRTAGKEGLPDWSAYRNRRTGPYAARSDDCRSKTRRSTGIRHELRKDSPFCRTDAERIRILRHEDYGSQIFR